LPPHVATAATSRRHPAAMHIIPAIDIKDGHCVRLKQGEMQSATVFSEDPAAMAQHWLELGAQRLHIVDLNGAFAGKPKNELAIREVCSVIGEEIPVQLGGGIRDLDTIERDGMLPGVNIEATVKLARELKIPVIASGGINSLKDIKELACYESEGVTGAIAGRALYDGTLDFKAALKAAKGK